MRRALAMGLALGLSSSIAAGQPAQPAPPAPPAPKAPAPAQPADDEDDDEDDDDAQTKPKATDIPEEPPSDAEPPPPVLPPPSPDEEKPGPYFPPPESTAKERKLELGPDIGVTYRAAEGDDVSYSPGFTWGVHLRVELAHFLGFRAYFNNSYHAVDVPNGALATGNPDQTVDQDDLHVTVIGMRLEPTWVVTPELRLWLGAGVAWGRVFAAEPRTRNPAVASSDRDGVLLEWTGSLGASYDVLPNWLAISLLVNGGMISSQSGDVFDRQQVIDQTGAITYLDGLPKFESTFSALFGVGIIL